MDIEGGGGGTTGWQNRGGVDRGVREQLFSYVTHCINLIHIALNFYQDIP